MINILSYVGMNMQSEVCLWCLLGLVRTIFDATLFKVNANLKQVWQMTMPEELTMPVQRVLRTMVSGVMLVQCFTVYVYLASYIVLLYPVFLEERPTLVLPWLLLAAVRKLLCELTSLALGLGTCVLLGPARPPCIKFVVAKFTSIMPAFYMWMLVFSYYHVLKVATAFKTFPAVLPPNENDYGLELAVRRRRTKSLFGEEQLRKKLVANFYGGRTSSPTNEIYLRPALEIASRMVHSTDTSIEEVPEADVLKPLTISTTGWSDIGAYEDWFGSEVMIPRDTDRILEQIVLMLLRIGAYLKKEGIESIIDSQKLNSAVPPSWHQRDNIDCATMNADDTDTHPLVGSKKGNMASYLRKYPQIFMKKQGTDILQNERTIASLKTVHNHVETDEGNTSTNKVKRNSPSTSNETISSVKVEKVASKRNITNSDINPTQEDKIVKVTLPSQLQTKKIKSRLKKQRDSDRQFKNNVNEMINNGDLQESKTLTYDNEIKNKDSTESQTLNEDAECTHSKTLNGNDNKKITHHAISNADNGKKNTEYEIPKENKNEEFTFVKISTMEEYKSLIQMKILNSDNSSEDSNVLTEYTNKESPHSQFLSVNNNEDFPLSGKVTEFKFKDSHDGKISNQASDDAILNEDTSGESTSRQIFNIDKNENFSLSRISNNDFNKNVTPSKIEKEFKHSDSKYGKISNENIANEGTCSKTLKDDRNKSLTCSQISDGNRSKEPPGVKISNEHSDSNLTHNTFFNVSKNKELTHETANKIEFTLNQISKDDKNKELPLRILSNDDNTKDSLDVKISNKESNRELTHSKSLEEYNNNEFIHKELSNKELIHNQTSMDNNNKGSSDIKILDKANNKGSTDGKRLNKVDYKEFTEADPDCNSNEQSVAENSNKSENNA